MKLLVVQEEICWENAAQNSTPEKESTKDHFIIGALTPKYDHLCIARPQEPALV
jgi:hypothetical protein